MDTWYFLGQEDISLSMRHLVDTSSILGEKEFYEDTGLNIDQEHYWFDRLIEKVTLEFSDWFDTGRLFKEPNTRLFVYHDLILPCIYECGTILGRSIKDKVVLLELMLPVSPQNIKSLYPDYPKNKQSLIDSAKEVANSRMNGFTSEFNREPDSFCELIGETVTHGFFNVFKVKYADDKKFSKVWCRRKISLKEVYKYIRAFLFEGIGFGSVFPDITEKMFRNKYEKIDKAAWEESRKEAVKDGRLFPEEPKIIELEVLEKAILHIVALCTVDFHPQLIQPLGLQDHAEAIQNMMGSDEWPEGYIGKFYRPNTFENWVEMYRCLLTK